MTDKQRLNELRRAVTQLKRTKEGYNQRGLHWQRAMEHLNAVIASLKSSGQVVDRPAASPFAGLGPVYPGGKSVLEQDLTHATDGLPLYPAWDDGFQFGLPVLAPEDLTVTRASHSKPGEAFYATGKSQLAYWFGHLASAPPTGKRFKRGETMGFILKQSPVSKSHVHVGLNIELIAGPGKELLHHTNYTHGAPKVGVQLAALGHPTA